MFHILVYLIKPTPVKVIIEIMWIEVMELIAGAMKFATSLVSMKKSRASVNLWTPNKLPLVYLGRLTANVALTYAQVAVMRPTRTTNANHVDMCRKATSA